MTEKMTQIADKILAGVQGYVVRSLQPLADRIKALENRPTLQYRGIWSQGVENKAGDFVTFDGSLWHCNATTQDRPGTSPTWTLAVKRGRDGR